MATTPIVAVPATQIERKNPFKAAYRRFGTPLLVLREDASIRSLTTRSLGAMSRPNESDSPDHAMSSTPTGVTVSPQAARVGVTERAPTICDRSRRD